VSYGEAVLRARAVAALVLPSGFVVGHLVGCAAAHGPHHDHGFAATLGEHSAFHSASQLALPLLSLSVLLAVALGARGERVRLSARSLAAVMASTFFVLEVIEHQAHGAGIGSTLVDPIVWVGLVAQLPLAACFTLLLRGASDVGARFCVSAPPVPRGAVRRVWCPHDERAGSTGFVSTISARGPPVRSFAH
jgi:hypothetical protein